MAIMDRLLRVLTESRFGRLLSGIGNVYFLGAGIGAAVGAVLTYATPMLDAPIHLQLIAIGGAAIAGAAGLGLVRNFVVDHAAPRSTATEQLELVALRAEVGAVRRQRKFEQIGQLEGRARELVAAYSAEEVAKRPTAKTDSIRDLDTLDADVKRVTQDEPDDWRDYSEQPANVVWSGLAWHEQVAAQFEYRRSRLAELGRRYL
jgi:hypothetical protein